MGKICSKLTKATPEQYIDVIFVSLLLGLNTLVTFT